MATHPAALAAMHPKLVGARQGRAGVIWSVPPILSLTAVALGSKADTWSPEHALIYSMRRTENGFRMEPKQARLNKEPNRPRRHTWRPRRQCIRRGVSPASWPPAGRGRARACRASPRGRLRTQQPEARRTMHMAPALLMCHTYICTGMRSWLTIKAGWFLRINNKKYPVLTVFGPPRDTWNCANIASCAARLIATASYEDDVQTAWGMGTRHQHDMPGGWGPAGYFLACSALPMPCNYSTHHGDLVVMEMAHEPLGPGQFLRVRPQLRKQPKCRQAIRRQPNHTAKILHCTAPTRARLGLASNHCGPQSSYGALGNACTPPVNVRASHRQNPAESGAPPAQNGRSVPSPLQVHT
jgi:hypothetical protein